jgi:LPS-assembly lipoprotein
MYGKQGDKQQVAQSFDRVIIATIPNREGQYLRNALIDRFYRNGYPSNAAYQLSVSAIHETLTDLDITKQSDTTRAQLRLDTSITLINTVTQETVLQDDLTSVAAYNVLDSQFTTRVSEDNTRKNALDDLARQIETRLALYFSR